MVNTWVNQQGDRATPKRGVHGANACLLAMVAPTLLPTEYAEAIWLQPESVRVRGDTSFFNALVAENHFDTKGRVEILPISRGSYAC